MRILILSFGVFFLQGCTHFGYTPVTGNSSCLRQYDSKLKMNIYSYVDEFPEPPGGLDAFSKYLMRNRTIDENDIQATLKFEIVIDADGVVIDEKILEKELDAYTVADKELLKRLKVMPKWKPGKCKNRKVAFRYPFRVSLHPSY